MYWTRPSPETEAQPVFRSTELIVREDKFVGTMSETDKDIKWEDLPLVPLTALPPDGTNTDQLAPTPSSLDVLVKVWRPDWETFKAPK